MKREYPYKPKDHQAIHKNRPHGRIFGNPNGEWFEID